MSLHQILPCQYFDVSPTGKLSGEQRLMLALLADAINVYQQGALSRNTRKRLLYIDAERWIMADRLDRRAFSFENTCEALGINPAVLRRGIIEWKHRVRRQSESRSESHLRLKVTPRSRNLSRPRRNRNGMASAEA